MPSREVFVATVAWLVVVSQACTPQGGGPTAPGHVHPEGAHGGEGGEPTAVSANEATANEATANDVTASDAGDGDAGDGDAGTIDEDGPPRAHAPTFDEEMACRRRRCYPAAANHCFEVCYRYNHPRDPATHDACNDNCRRSWDVDACEQACALDRRAFVANPTATSPACATSLRSCRAACGPRLANSCELECVVALTTCDP